jgi:uncharacterized damage-inducible protein DinB
MTTKIEKLWQTLEQQRVDLFNELDRVDQSLLNQQPAPNTWTAHQNLEHLLKAETTSLSYLQKKLSSGSGGIPKAGFKSWGRRFLLRLAFTLPMLKFQAPKYLEELPETSDFQDLKARFTQQRAALKSFLDTLPNEVLEGEIWKHARAGKMSIAQMLDFFEDHFNRHEQQLKRAIAVNTRKIG